MLPQLNPFNLVNSDVLFLSESDEFELVCGYTNEWKHSRFKIDVLYNLQKITFKAKLQSNWTPLNMPDFFETNTFTTFFSLPITSVLLKAIHFPGQILTLK